MRARLIFFTLLLAAAPALPGQPGASLRVNVLRTMEFGNIIGGVNATIGPTDSKTTAMFEILGPAGATVQLVFTLPGGMIGDSGGQLDISFGAQSAAYSLNESSADNIPFDPRAPFALKLPANGRVVVMIGGTARPSAQLTSGRYTGNLSLSVTTQ